MINSRSLWQFLNVFLTSEDVLFKGLGKVKAYLRCAKSKAVLSTFKGYFNKGRLLITFEIKACTR